MGSDAQQTIVGIDVGGTKTAVVEGSYAGEILRRQEFETEAEKPYKETCWRIYAAIDRTLKLAAYEGRKAGVISVSIGGPLRISEGFILDPPHLPGWHNLALQSELARRFSQLPVLVEHDGNAGALAEFHFGVGRNEAGLQHLIFLTFGTGLGAGIVVNGAILHGASDTAGEVGHWRLSDKGPVGFGKAGSWEGYASGAGLVQLAVRMFPKRWKASTPIREVVEAMLADDAQGLEVAAEAGRWMGRGMALLVDAFNPQMIVLGSLAVALGERVLSPAREVVQAEALPQAAAACRIVPSALGSSIGDVASLMAAIAQKSRMHQQKGTTVQSR
ncbi:MAG TPA: ROK family protein [Terriglobales bacterium]|nr:ROK family protein [Terriglobales bacterium]